MTNDDFAAQFSADELAELAALEKAMQDAEAEKPAPVAQKAKDGLWYAEDEVEATNGHTISWYRLVAFGKTLLWFSLDNDLEVSAPAGLHVPPGVTVHTIRVHNATRTASLATGGVGARAPHKDGTGVHIDGTTVRQYVAPRAARWISHFYGV